MLSRYKNYSKHQYIKGDRIYYPSFFSKENIIDWLLCTEKHLIRCYLKALRSEEYYSFIRPNKIISYYYSRRKNKLGVKLGFFIPKGCFGLGLHLAHYGSVIINPRAIIGENCTIHGNCCIGNTGSDEGGLPVLGNNIDIGQGAQILGDVKIADGVRVGAGSIVLKSVIEEGASVVGIPGRVLLKRQDR
ncbi:serine O-acetyltransferase [Sphingobacterium endophyticum]|uniref:serine O-acetyltransferase n=1 Tax=Sphingobacterium endophyticum TaxID=2546448 RepID=UPI0012E25A40|nr:serine acetyltransferase [Sphingobacterium endophyticum]